MEKLTTDFYKLEKEITALSYLAGGMFFVLVLHVIWLLYEGKINEVWIFSGLLVALISALLVSKAASRLLVHNRITRKDDRKQDIVRITHHLLAVIEDLISRINYAVISLRDGNRPLIALTKNAATIEKRFEVFFDRELYRFLNPESVDLVGRMSGTIFAFCALSEALAVKFSDKPDLPFPSSKSPDSQKVVELLEALLVDLKSFDEQIRHLRESI